MNIEIKLSKTKQPIRRVTLKVHNGTQVLSVYTGKRRCPYRFELVDGTWQPRPLYPYRERGDKWNFAWTVSDPLPMNDTHPPRWLQTIVRDVF